MKTDDICRKMMARLLVSSGNHDFSKNPSKSIATRLREFCFIATTTDMKVTKINPMN